MVQTRIESKAPALRWEDAMISGNGSTGIMVMGQPLEETIIINHEKLWVVMAHDEPQTPDVAEAWMEARAMAFEGRYRDAYEHFMTRRAELTKEMLRDGPTPDAHRLAYDHIHPGLLFNIDTDACGRIENYRRQTLMNTGEVRIAWSDAAGKWERRTFVSRTDDVIVMDFKAPVGDTMTCRLRLGESPGKQVDEIGSVSIRHTEDEMYFHADYARTMGRHVPEGYQLLARVIPRGGNVHVVQNEGVNLAQVESVLVIMRLRYLDDSTTEDIDSVRDSLAELPDDYDTLLVGHAAIHGEMFERVTLDLDATDADAVLSEELIADGKQNGASARLLEMTHAVGRYALICGGTGDLPVALSGIWGNTWNPPWDGRYTFDANINLAISGVSQGDLPEVMETYCRYIEDSLDDWRYNAKQVFGCRGILTDLCQGWRHGKALMLYPWVGGAGWLVSYVYDHYRYTQDRQFLRDRLLPLLEDTARFYEDFLKGTEGEDGRVRFYPSVSPENFPIIADSDQTSSVVPNATCEIAVCRETLENVIEAYAELGIESDELIRWKDLLVKLPDYVINGDGALSEWAHPGMGDRYNHRHSSHLYPLWPAMECTPERDPELFEASRKAVAKRLDAGLGNRSAHGFLHLELVAARLRDPDLLWKLLDDFSRESFFNSSMISCHNPGLMIYNLDATFTLPSVLTKMLMHSVRGRLELLPALPSDRLGSGTVRGLRARGGVTVEEMHWNMLRGRIVIQLLSDTEQTIVLDSAYKLRGIKPGPGCPPEVELTGGDRTEWTVRLPAGKSVRLYCNV